MTYDPDQPRAPKGVPEGGQWIKVASNTLRSYGFDTYESKVPGKVVRVEYNGKSKDMDANEMSEFLQGVKSGNVYSSEGVNLLSTEPYASAFERKQQEAEKAARSAAGLGHLSAKNVTTERYQASHGKAPSDKTYGLWVFSIDGNQVVIPGVYKTARREAVEFANRHGAARVEVMP